MSISPWRELIHRPLLATYLWNHYQVSKEENRQAIDELTLRQFARVLYVGIFLTFLACAYMVMYYGFSMRPDDEFYSVIAMFVLFSTSLVSSVTGITLYHFHHLSSRLARILSIFYFAAIVVVIGLYFQAATMNEISRQSFCPSFLYLLILAIFASPYLWDSLFFWTAGIAEILSISILGGVSTVMVVQYSLISLILLVGMFYLSAMNYIAKVKEIRLNKANDELAFLSTHDPLTCIGNRHSLHTYLSSHWESFSNQATPVAFLIFDVDSFKAYNDTFSHVQGDECLRQVVESVLRAKLFPSEDFYRFGGDEFLVVLPGAKADEVAKIGCGIVTAVYSRQISAPPSAHYPYVSVSLGAYLGQIVVSKGLDDYLAEADKQLYLAKGDGNNACYFRDERVA